MLQIEEVLLDNESQLQTLNHVIASIDAIISLGTIAIEQHLICPEIIDDDNNNIINNSSNVIIIKNGRHLLQECTVDSFVSNDTYITNEKNIALITGPNMSGKSVYLKQVGLIVYLAHIGYLLIFLNFINFNFNFFFFGFVANAVL